MDESYETQFRDALDYLYSFIDYSRVKQAEVSLGAFNLDQMKAFLILLGNPEEKIKCIHVAGTKGKGSTASIIAQILRENGYSVGLYTSPHLQEFNERIQINGVSISKKDFISLINSFKPILSQLGRITTFEITTAMAFTYFASKNVDYAVIEVGLGGRLDATNVITPLISVITSISFDHMKILGNTIKSIASEKGGIIKCGIPVVISQQVYPEAEQVLRLIAEHQQSPLISAPEVIGITKADIGLNYQNFYAYWENERHLFSLRLMGDFQLENAATALATVLGLRKIGLDISTSQVERAFQSVVWPGRFEILHSSPPVVIDSAHNPYSMERLVESVDRYFPGKKMILLFGASNDKDIHGMLQKILPKCSIFIASQSIHPRSCPPDGLLSIANSLGYNGTAITPIEEALPVAFKLVDSDSFLLATGSIFFSAAVRNVWHEKFHPLPGFGK